MKRQSGSHPKISSQVALWGKIYRSPFLRVRLVIILVLRPRSMMATRFPFYGDAVGEALQETEGSGCILRWRGSFCEFYGIFSIIAANNGAATHRAMDPGLDRQAAGIHAAIPRSFLFEIVPRTVGFASGDSQISRQTAPRTLVHLALHVLHIGTIISDGREGEHQDLARHNWGRKAPPCIRSLRC